MAQTVCVVVNAAEREQLAVIVADRNRPRKHVERARIVLASADRHSAQQVAQSIGISPWRGVVHRGDTTCPVERTRRIRGDARSRRLEIRPQNGRPLQSPNHLAGNPAVNRGTQHPHAIPRFHLGRALPDPEFGGCGRIVGHLAAGRHPRMRRTRTGMR